MLIREKNLSSLDCIITPTVIDRNIGFAYQMRWNMYLKQQKNIETQRRIKGPKTYSLKDRASQYLCFVRLHMFLDSWPRCVYNLYYSAFVLSALDISNIYKRIKYVYVSRVSDRFTEQLTLYLIPAAVIWFDCDDRSVNAMPMLACGCLWFCALIPSASLKVCVFFVVVVNTFLLVFSVSPCSQRSHARGQTFNCIYIYSHISVWPLYMWRGLSGTHIVASCIIPNWLNIYNRLANAKPVD